MTLSGSVTKDAGNSYIQFGQEYETVDTWSRKFDITYRFFYRKTMV
jgi:hypothetical protein